MMIHTLFLAELMKLLFRLTGTCLMLWVHRDFVTKTNFALTKSYLPGRVRLPATWILSLSLDVPPSPASRSIILYIGRPWDFPLNNNIISYNYSKNQPLQFQHFYRGRSEEGGKWLRGRNQLDVGKTCKP